MTDQPSTPELTMDAEKLYREEIVTDRSVGTIRRLVPVTSGGEEDPGRDVVYVGQAQLLTPLGAVPLSFEIEASSLAGAVEGFPAAAEKAVQETMEEMQELRRQAASSIVVPESGAGLGGPGGMPDLGGGKIKLP